MNKFFESIDKQIESNRGKNIFLSQPGLLHFIRETVESISKLDQLQPEQQRVLIDYAAEKSHEEFCRVNQYYSFGSEPKAALRNVYIDLLAAIQQKNQTVDALAENHYKKLKSWLLKYNAFGEKLYENAGLFVNTVVCSEYSAELQLEILEIDINSMLQPVLDVGCGKKGALVKFLGAQGINAYGIDRFAFNSPNLFTSDWLEFDYGREKWGTIISNLGFSNHFNHHHLREDGNYIGYGKTYMNILHSLKPGGSFHYAPYLPFIEKYLDVTHFVVEKRKVNKNDFKSTVTRRL